MRMRKKKNLDVRFAACADVMVFEPKQLRGKWRALFGNDNPLHLEIGCGKGAFIRGTAVKEPDVNFIALERCSDVAMIAMEKCKAAEIPNVRFMIGDVAKLAENFTDGSIDRIYLNFSDPWPKAGHAKRRLTYRSFLSEYRRLLKPGGAIFFKTDNRGLFDFSLEEFRECGWRLEDITYDLHNSEYNADNVMTEYEKNFSERGFTINRVEAYADPLPEKAPETDIPDDHSGTPSD